MDSTQLGGTLHPEQPPHEGSSAPGGRRAIALRLTEDVLQRLIEMAQGGQGDLKIDLGDNPAFLVQGDSFPLTLDPEGPLHSVARRVGGPAPGWQPLAPISHRARLKPTPAALHKAGQGLRGNYQQTEHDRAERRTQVLEAPAGFAASRTASPAPGGADGRNGSKARAPSRLTAAPPKPTTSFRLGKGALPPSAGMARGGSEGGDKAEADAKAEEQPVASTSAGPRAASPTRKTSSSSDGSSNGGNGSHTSKSTARTSLSSAGSPPGVTVALAADGAPAKARGGVMKGKETLKKEAKAAAKVGTTSKPSSSTAQSPPQPKKARITKSPSPPPSTKPKPSSSSTSLSKKASQSSVPSDKDAESDLNSKKRRKLLNGVGEDPTRSRKGSASPARAPTPISSPRPDPKAAKSAKDSSKKRPKPERWYSSSDEDQDAEGEDDVDISVRPSEGADKRRRTNSNEPTPKLSEADRGRLRVPSHLASASPRMTGSPLRSSGTLPIDIPASLIRVTSRKEYDTLAAQFNEGFKAYAKLHGQLDEERERLEHGEEATITLADTERLVRRVETSRAKLEADKVALTEWVKREKDKPKA